MLSRLISRVSLEVGRKNKGCEEMGVVEVFNRHESCWWRYRERYWQVMGEFGMVFAKVGGEAKYASSVL